MTWLTWRKTALAEVALLGVTVIWGSTFVIIQDAIATAPVFLFLTMRFTLALIALVPLLVIGVRRDSQASQGLLQRYGVSLLAGMFLGIPVFAGYAFQTWGLTLTTPARAGFITGLSVVMVPVFLAAWTRRWPGGSIVLGVLLATAGLALLSLTADPAELDFLSFNRGDALVFCCAIGLALQILLTGWLSPRLDALWLTAGQLLTVALFSAGLACGSADALGLAQRDSCHFSGLSLNVWGAAIFCGVLATTLAFSVQTYAQRRTTSTRTALIFAMEPVFAAFFSVVLIGEILTPRMLLGCGLILCGMLVTEMRAGS